MPHQYSTLATTVWSFIQQGILHAGALLVTLMLTRSFSTDEYGVIATASTVVMIVTALLGFGIPAATGRFLAQTSASRARLALIRKSILLSLISAVAFALFCALLLPFYARISNIEVLTMLSIPIFALLVTEHLRNLGVKIHQSIGAMHYAAHQSLAMSLLLIALTAGVVFFNGGIYDVLSVRAIAIGASILLFAASVRKLTRSDSASTAPTTSSLSILRYGIPLSITSISSFFFIQADIITLSVYGETSAIAFYSVSAFVLAKLMIASFSIGMGVGPRLTSAPLSPEQDERTPLLAKALRFSLIFSCLIFIIAETVGTHVLAIIFGEAYRESGWSLRILAVFFLIQGVVAITGPALDYTGLAAARAKASFVAGTLNIGGNIALYPVFGPAGIAYASVFAYTVVFSANIYCTAKISSTHAFLNRENILLVTCILPLGVLTGLVGSTILGESTTAVLATLLLIIAAYLFLIIVFRITSLEEITTLLKTPKRLIS